MKRVPLAVYAFASAIVIIGLRLAGVSMATIFVGLLVAVGVPVTLFWSGGRGDRTGSRRTNGSPGENRSNGESLISSLVTVNPGFSTRLP